MLAFIAKYLPYLIVIASAIVATIPVFFKCILERDGHNVWHQHKIMGNEISVPVLTKAGWWVGGCILLFLAVALAATHKTEKENEVKEKKLTEANNSLIQTNKVLQEEVGNLKQETTELRKTAEATRISTNTTGELVGTIKSRIETELPRFISGAINESKDNIEREIREGIKSAITSSQGQIEQAVKAAVVNFQDKVTTIVDQKVGEAKTEIGKAVNSSQGTITEFVKQKIKESTDATQIIVASGTKESVKSVTNATKEIGNNIMGLPLRFEQKMPPRRLTGPLSDLFLKVDNVSDNKPVMVHVLATDSVTHLACTEINGTKYGVIHFQHPNKKLGYRIELTLFPQNGFLGFGGIDYLVAQSTEDPASQQKSSSCAASTKIAIAQQQKRNSPAKH